MTRILQGQFCTGQCELGRSSEVSRFLCSFDVVPQGEALHRARNSGGILLHVITRKINYLCAGADSHQGVPVSLFANAYRCYRAESCNDDPSLVFPWSLEAH